ncbi:BspA family leucine-rich repeat surface protein, partial [Campylobacter sp.]
MDIFLGDIDTSAITDMNSLFFKGYDENRKIIINERENFDGIELWDVSNVADMRGMFYGCRNFNQPLNSWNIDDNTNTKDMFN